MSRNIGPAFSRPLKPGLSSRTNLGDWRRMSSRQRPVEGPGRPQSAAQPVAPLRTTNESTGFLSQGAPIYRSRRRASPSATMPQLANRAHHWGACGVLLVAPIEPRKPPEAVPSQDVLEELKQLYPQSPSYAGISAICMAGRGGSRSASGGRKTEGAIRFIAQTATKIGLSLLHGKIRGTQMVVHIF